MQFSLDALASVALGHSQNKAAITQEGSVALIIRALKKFPERSELLWSGCHALAVLSDADGCIAQIAKSGGTSVLIDALRTHHDHAELQKVACVVLLRLARERREEYALLRFSVISAILAAPESTVVVSVLRIFRICEPRSWRKPGTRSASSNCVPWRCLMSMRRRSRTPK